MPGSTAAARHPPGSVYDAINALVNDEGYLFRRGGSAYHSASDADTDGEPLIRLDALYYPGVGAARVTAWGNTKFFAFNGPTPIEVGTGFSSDTPIGRPASLGGIAVFPADPHGAMMLYGGSLKDAGLIGGTVSTTAGSTTVTGSGTTWLADVDPGMLLNDTVTGETVAVRSVASDTQLTLASPWSVTVAGSTAFAFFPAMYIAGPPVGTLPFPQIGTATYVTTAGSGLPRLLVGIGNRIYESTPGDAFSNSAFDANLYHEVPSNADITGLEGIGDSAFVFTTAGVWRLDNLSLDIVDDYGNVQQQVSAVSGDIVLWKDLGVVAWSGAVLAPALDDVYLLTRASDIKPADDIQAISASIRPLYRSHVAAGYLPGRATVHRGHYFLPILDGTTVVDMLVCRLDRGFPWTRWAGHGAAAGWATMTAAGAAPKLLGMKGQRVTDLTGAMNPSGAAQDADSTTPVFRIDENDLDTGPGIRPNTVEKVRYVYETTGGTPTITVQSATGPEGSSYSAAVLKRGGGASNGTDWSAWKLAEKTERIRFRFECSSQVTSLVLRRREVHIRSGAQT